MASHHLSNHVRKYRKRAALSQRDVAYLLGVTSGGSKVSRYERFAHTPGFLTALAYEAIFRVPVSDLFPGEYQKIGRGVRRRAKKLLELHGQKKSTPRALRKRQALEAIAGMDSKPPPK